MCSIMFMSIFIHKSCFQTVRNRFVWRSILGQILIHGVGGGSISDSIEPYILTKRNMSDSIEPYILTKRSMSGLIEPDIVLPPTPCYSTVRIQFQKQDKLTHRRYAPSFERITQ